MILNNDEEYNAAMTEVMQYFRTLPKYEKNYWIRTTKLLQSLMKYEKLYPGFNKNTKNKLDSDKMP